MLTIRSAIFLTSSIFSSIGISNAQQYMVLGQGNLSCGAWTQERQHDTLVARTTEAWVLGYLTSFNASIAPARGGDISRGTDPNGLAAWIDNYCARHPLDPIAIATSELIAKLIRSPQY